MAAAADPLAVAPLLRSKGVRVDGNDWTPVRFRRAAAGGSLAPGRAARAHGLRGRGHAGARWSVHEIALMARRDHVDAYLVHGSDVATFRGPGGELTGSARGFWDGGGKFKVRFTPTVEGGEPTRSGPRRADAGLTTRGAFTTGDPLPFAHGFLRRDEQ